MYDVRIPRRSSFAASVRWVGEGGPGMEGDTDDGTSKWEGRSAKGYDLGIKARVRMRIRMKYVCNYGNDVMRWGFKV